jgi:hypothetical protein
VQRAGGIWERTVIQTQRLLDERGPTLNLYMEITAQHIYSTQRGVLKNLQKRAVNSLSDAGLASISTAHQPLVPNVRSNDCPFVSTQDE